MRYALILALALSGCGMLPTQLQTVTITKTVPVFPPSTLYGTDGGCKHGPMRTTGTVQNLADSLIIEREAIDTCLGDRAALRQWVRDNKQ